MLNKSFMVHRCSCAGAMSRRFVFTVLLVLLLHGYTETWASSACFTIRIFPLNASDPLKVSEIHVINHATSIEINSNTSQSSLLGIDLDSTEKCRSFKQIPDEESNLWKFRCSTNWAVNVWTDEYRVAVVMNREVREHFSEKEAGITYFSACPTQPNSKCCMVTSTYYLSFTLETVTEPVSCTGTSEIRPSIFQYSVTATDGVTTARSDSIVSRSNASALFERNLTLKKYSSTFPGLAVELVLDHSRVNLSSISETTTQRLCRQGSSLLDTSKPTPFLAPAWMFGTQSRQIGYTLANYLNDKQCDGMPLGLLTSFDGNNEDQFSIARNRLIGSAAWLQGRCWWVNEMSIREVYNPFTGNTTRTAVSMKLGCHDMGTIQANVSLLFTDLARPGVPNPIQRAHPLIRIVGISTALLLVEDSAAALAITPDTFSFHLVIGIDLHNADEYNAIDTVKLELSSCCLEYVPATQEASHPFSGGNHLCNTNERRMWWPSTSEMNISLAGFNTTRTHFAGAAGTVKVTSTLPKDNVALAGYCLLTVIGEGVGQPLQRSFYFWRTEHYTQWYEERSRPQNWRAARSYFLEPLSISGYDGISTPSVFDLALCPIDFAVTVTLTPFRTVHCVPSSNATCIKQYFGKRDAFFTFYNRCLSPSWGAAQWPPSTDAATLATTTTVPSTNLVLPPWMQPLGTSFLSRREFWAQEEANDGSTAEPNAVVVYVWTSVAIATLCFLILDFLVFVTVICLLVYLAYSESSKQRYTTNTQSTHLGPISGASMGDGTDNWTGPEYPSSRHRHHYTGDNGASFAPSDESLRMSAEMYGGHNTTNGRSFISHRGGGGPMMEYRTESLVMEEGEYNDDDDFGSMGSAEAEPSITFFGAGTPPKNAGSYDRELG